MPCKHEVKGSIPLFSTLKMTEGRDGATEGEIVLLNRYKNTMGPRSGSIPDVFAISRKGLTFFDVLERN
jgi:hypothetical protein